MILIISLCKEKFHELEFVKPIEKILKKDYLVKNYKEVTQRDLAKADKVILSGTSLKDFDYSNHLDKFSWLRDFEKPVLGICAGMQVIGLIFGASLTDGKEIGQGEVGFEKTFLGLKGKNKVYYLHGKVISLPAGFIGNNFAFRSFSKKIYGVLFHPEVYNHKLIENFVKI